MLCPFHSPIREQRKDVLPAFADRGATGKYAVLKCSQSPLTLNRIPTIYPCHGRLRPLPAGERATASFGSMFGGCSVAFFDLRPCVGHSRAGSRARVVTLRLSVTYQTTAAYFSRSAMPNSPFDLANSGRRVEAAFKNDDGSRRSSSQITSATILSPTSPRCSPLRCTSASANTYSQRGASAFSAGNL